jgi:DNA-binding XRE family transcriptional regulator
MGIQADRVRECRIAAGLSQAELGKRIGVSQQTIQKIENGTTQNPRYVVEIALVLKKSPQYLKGLSNDPEPGPTKDDLKAAIEDLPQEEVAAVLREVQRRLSGSK